MNRTMLITGIVCVLVVVGIALIFILRMPKSVQQSGGIVTGLPGANDTNYMPYTSGSSQSGTDINDPSKNAVRAVFMAKIGASNPDNIQPGETTIIGKYALQNWVGTVTAGQALLNFDGTNEGWTFIVSTGGVWSVEELVQYHNVPEEIASLLVLHAR